MNFNYWHKFYQENATNFKCPKKQVGKTVDQIAVDDHQISLIVNNAISTLKIDCFTTLLDLGCGNGLLTSQLAKECKHAYALDFSSNLIQIGCWKYKKHNVTYSLVDFVEQDCSGVARLCDKIIMYEVIQHLNEESFAKLLLNINSVKEGTKFLIGGVPDQKRFNLFYNSPNKRIFRQETIENNRPHLGKFWDYETIREISMQKNWNSKKLDQPSGLYSAYYRYDVLLHKDG